MSRGTLVCVLTPGQTLQLTPQQQMALVVMEIQQAAMAAAANVLKHPNCGQAEAALALEEGIKALDVAKMKWLDWTQHAVQVVSAIPDKLKLVTG
jgi:hypothetical protein